MEMSNFLKICIFYKTLWERNNNKILRMFISMTYWWKFSVKRKQGDLRPLAEGSWDVCSGLRGHLCPRPWTKSCPSPFCLEEWSSCDEHCSCFFSGLSRVLDDSWVISQGASFSVGMSSFCPKTWKQDIGGWRRESGWDFRIKSKRISYAENILGHRKREENRRATFSFLAQLGVHPVVASGSIIWELYPQRCSRGPDSTWSFIPSNAFLPVR